MINELEAELKGLREEKEESDQNLASLSLESAGLKIRLATIE